VSPNVHESRAGGGIPAQREPLRARITGSAVSLFAVAVTAGYSPTFVDQWLSAANLRAQLVRLESEGSFWRR
jgi:hypothetical protein